MRSAGSILDVAIVSFRCEQPLRECLLSLRAHPPSAGARVMVWDNASGDGTAAMVEREFPEVELTRSDQNIGFGRATNRLLESGSAPFALALNPDTRLEAGTLDGLLDLFAERPEVGLAGPRLERADGSLDHAARRSFPTPLSALGHFTGVGRRMRGGALADYRAPGVERGAVDAVNGAFMLFRRSALDQVGGFDERYWMYMEDLDLCRRFADAGWATWYEPTLRAGHLKGASAGRHRSLRLNFAFHRGMWLYYSDHLAPSSPSPVNLAVRLAIAVKFAIAASRSAIARLLSTVRSLV